LAIFYDFIFIYRAFLNYIKICCNKFWTRSNNFVRYVSKVAPSSQVFIQTARWHSTRAELLRNPASHHGVVYRCRARTVLFVVSRTAISRFRSEKIQDQASQKNHTKRMTIVAWYKRFIKTCCVFHSSQVRVDRLRRQKMWGRTSFAVHENQLSAPFGSWSSPKLQGVKFWRNGCVASHKNYNWCKLRAFVTKKNHMSFVVKCLTKWKTKMISWIKLWLVKRHIFIRVATSVVIMGCR